MCVSSNLKGWTTLFLVITHFYNSHSKAILDQGLLGARGRQIGRADSAWKDGLRDWGYSDNNKISVTPEMLEEAFLGLLKRDPEYINFLKPELAKMRGLSITNNLEVLRAQLLREITRKRGDVTAAIQGRRSYRDFLDNLG